MSWELEFLGSTPVFSSQVVESSMCRVLLVQVASANLSVVGHRIFESRDFCEERAASRQLARLGRSQGISRIKRMPIFSVLCAAIKAKTASAAKLDLTVNNCKGVDTFRPHVQAGHSLPTSHQHCKLSCRISLSRQLKHSPFQREGGHF